MVCCIFSDGVINSKQILGLFYPILCDSSDICVAKAKLVVCLVITAGGRFKLQFYRERKALLVGAFRKKVGYRNDLCIG